VSTPRAVAIVAAPILLTCVIGACGGQVVFVEDDDGAGGSGTTTTTSKSATATKSTTGTGFTTATGTSAQCAGLPFGHCITSPACAPIFDDLCCPSCDPGPCLDCVDWGFVGCMDRESVCAGNIQCGFAGDYICQGTQPSCRGFCDGTIGCEHAVCPQNGPPCDVCIPILPGICDSSCDEPPPSCPAGFVGATDGFCWTGLCIPESFCFLPTP
jgi:hypothetical protein